MGAISDFIRHHYRHFNAAALVDAAEAYVQAPRRRRQDARHARRRHEHGRARAVARRDDPPRQGARDLLHRREPRGGHLQPRRARPLRAHPELPRPDAGGRGRAARPAPEPRHRHLHPRGRGDPPHRERRARRVAARRQGRRSSSSRTSSCTRSCASGVLEEHYQIDPEGQLAAGGRESDLPIFVPGWEDSTLGNIFAGHCIARRHRQRAHGAHAASST